jgi:hypothetical protein
MTIAAINVKNWCNSELSPLAWKRIIMKALPYFREKGLSLTDLDDSESLIFDKNDIEVVSNILFEIYQVELPFIHSDDKGILLFKN